MKQIIFNPRQGHKGSLENKIFNQTLFFSSLQSFAFLEADFLSILEKPSQHVWCNTNASLEKYGLAFLRTSVSKYVLVHWDTYFNCKRHLLHDQMCDATTPFTQTPTTCKRPHLKSI